MATPKDSAEDATVDDSDNSTPNESNGSVAKSNGSKPGVDQIRKRAYEIFEQRRGGNALGDWQKAEASVAADAHKADAAKSDDKADATKADAAQPDDSKADESKAAASKAHAPKDGGTEADGAKGASSKGVQIPSDTGTIQEALTKFKSNIEHGLTQEEAAKRLKDGPNAIEEQHISPLKRFLTFLWGPIPWMIEIAAVLSAVVRHWEDFVIIFFMLALNAVVGFWEEFKADNEIEALKKNLALYSRVLRDGKWSDVEAKTLVTGDIVMVKLVTSSPPI
jgi:magnesium-transporting ATPase (P-type)